MTLLVRARTFLVLGVAFSLSISGRAQGLPAVPEPAGNPLTAAKAVLGKILFWDEQLSDDNTVACGTCHRPERGGEDPRSLTPGGWHPGADGLLGTPDDGRGSPSVVPCSPGGTFVDDGVFFPARRVTHRKAPSNFGALFDEHAFWDGRAGAALLTEGNSSVVLANGAALENQATIVLMSEEMGCSGRTWGGLTQKLAAARPLALAVGLPADCQNALAAFPDYPSLFAQAFGDPLITRERIAMALASYERTLIPDQTPFDAYLQGASNALSASQLNGLTVFVVQYCVFCHTLPQFSDSSFRNIGVRPPAEDLGRALVTLDPAHRGQFKVPTLRNAGLRAPYFHNGSASTLEDVVRFYERGGDFGDNRDTTMAPFFLSAQERADLVEFLQNALTDPRCLMRLPPFDRPTLRSELPANPVIDGHGSNGSGGAVPSMLAPAPPFLGSDRFVLGVAHGLGGQAALLLLGAPASTNFGPHPIFVRLDLPLTVIPSVLQGSGPSAGFVSQVFSIPAEPLLAGIALNAQWIVLDSAGAFGFSASNVARITLLAP